MLLLGIDTSGKTASAALLDTDAEVILAETSLYTQKTHSQVIMPAVKGILRQTGKEMSELGEIAVAAGPGSYTGLRIGVAAVKAMCFALGVKCCGTSTLKALAYNNIAFHGTICSVMKARGELVYACAYKSDGYSLEPLFEERLMSRDELALELAFSGEEALLCGDGAGEFFTANPSPKLFIAPPQGRLQTAAGVCLSAMSEELIDPEELEVAYLQKVKAEKDLEDRQKNFPKE